jgi:DNA-binding transcriptional ArsR family regulator
MTAGPSSAVFRAFADQTRRDILKMLRFGPLTSGQIADKFDSSWPTISRHLSVLANAGLVVAVRRGAEIYYELNTTVLQDLAQHIMEWTQPKAPKGGNRAAIKRRSTRPQEA